MTDPQPLPLRALSIERAGNAVGQSRAFGARRRRVVAAGLLVALGLALGYLWYARDRAVPVEIGIVAAAYPSQALSVLNATGRVVAARRASVSSKATGRLEWLGVQEGQRVKAGEIIARLENRDVAAQREQSAAQVQAAQANLAQGEAELADAQAALARARELAGKNFITPAAVDTAEARYNKAQAAIRTLQAQITVARANLKAADVNVDQTLIRAPFDGIVLTKSANVGDIVTPFSSAAGTIGAVVTMADMSTLEVEADVSENAIAKVKVGQPAELQLDAFPDLRLAGSVSRVVPTVDRSKATLLVKLRFDETDPRVLPDMSARVAFLSRPLAAEERAPVPAVRPDALVQRDGRTVVFVIEPADGQGAAAGGGTVVPTAVTPGARIGDLVRVDALAPGTRVVIGPPPSLRESRRVEAVRK